MIPHEASRASYQQGCRCLPCKVANAVYECERARDEAMGQARGQLVDAGKAQAHLEALSEAGVGYDRASTLSGLSTSYLFSVRTGRRTHLRPRTEAAILAIPASPADGSFVNNYHTRHLIQCLRGEGYTLHRLARELRVRLSWLTHDGRGARTGRTHVRRGIAQRVRDFHQKITDESWSE